MHEAKYEMPCAVVFSNVTGFKRGTYAEKHAQFLPGR